MSPYFARRRDGCWICIIYKIAIERKYDRAGLYDASLHSSGIDLAELNSASVGSFSVQTAAVGSVKQRFERTEELVLMSTLASIRGSADRGTGSILLRLKLTYSSQRVTTYYRSVFVLKARKSVASYDRNWQSRSILPQYSLMSSTQSRFRIANCAGVYSRCTLS